LRWGADEHQRNEADDADDQPEHEDADRVPAAAAALDAQHALRHRTALVVGERALALDQPARDIARHRLADVADLVALGQHGAAVARVLHEAVLTLVAP